MSLPTNDFCVNWIVEYYALELKLADLLVKPPGKDCVFCKQREKETQLHFVLNCEHYKDVRNSTLGDTLNKDTFLVSLSYSATVAYKVIDSLFKKNSKVCCKKLSA